MATLLFVNGSVRGDSGNTAALGREVIRLLPEGTQADELVLASYSGTVEALVERVERADALLFGTGVYWGSWGSPLQRFLEVMTAYELESCFLGKPVGAVVTSDSVGGLDRRAASARIALLVRLLGSTLVDTRLVARRNGSRRERRERRRLAARRSRGRGGKPVESERAACRLGDLARPAPGSCDRSVSGERTARRRPREVRAVGSRIERATSLRVGVALTLTGRHRLVVRRTDFSSSGYELDIHR